MKIELNEHPSAGDTLVVRLPTEIGIADTDRDGDLLDEVNEEDTFGIGTGYRLVTSVTNRTIVIKSTYGGLKGAIYLHFPIITPQGIDSTQLAYGQVSFSNNKEQPVSAGQIMLEIVRPRNLNTVDLNSVFNRALSDTITNSQGDIFPTDYGLSAGVRFPDFLQDESNNIGRYGLISGNIISDGDNNNDTRFFVWISTNKDLDRVYKDVASPAVSATTGAPIEKLEGELMDFKLKIDHLDEITHYVYLTSNLTGEFPLARSRGFRVKHEPIFSWVGQFQSSNSDYIDSGNLLNFDTGEPGVQSESRNSILINFQAVDYNDSATVSLYYAKADTFSIPENL